MAVVRKAQSGAIIKKKSQLNAKARSVRQPSRIEEMSDTAFGTLDQSKDGLIVSFDQDSKTFVLTTADALLDKSAEDGDISDTFITQLEEEISVDIPTDSVDGGLF